jgi:hypothetical protein
VHVPEDLQEQQQWMLDLLIKNYGIPGQVINPENHLIPHDLPQPEEFLEKGKKAEAQTLKENDRLYDVIAYLQERHGLFSKGTLYDDCPIHSWFGKRTEDDSRIYQEVFRIIPRQHGYLAFTCTKDCECQWVECPIHPSRAFADQRFDPFDLLQVLDSIQRGCRYPIRHGNIDDYRSELAQALGIATRRLRVGTRQSAHGMGRYKGKRYAADRNQLLIEIMYSVPQDDRDVKKFIARVCRLITYGKEPEPVFDKTSSRTTVWFPETSLDTIRKSGASSRLWLYLWILQQQERKHVVANGCRAFLFLTSGCNKGLFSETCRALICVRIQAQGKEVSDGEEDRGGASRIQRDSRVHRKGGAWSADTRGGRRHLPETSSSGSHSLGAVRFGQRDREDGRGIDQRRRYRVPVPA